MTHTTTAHPPLRTLHEIRLEGRGGQGIVTAGELIGEAALLDGRFAQSIPAFGRERRGALSTCMVRLAEGEILLRTSGKEKTLQTRITSSFLCRYAEDY